MAKIIKYQIATEIPHLLEDGKAEIEIVLMDASISCATEEIFNANLPIAQKEAYNGEYTIEDDGQPEPVETPTKEEELEARLTYVEMMTGLLEV